MLRDDDEAEDESLLVREDDKGGRTAPMAVVVWCRAASCEEGAGVEVEPRHIAVRERARGRLVVVPRQPRLLSYAYALLCAGPLEGAQRLGTRWQYREARGVGARG